MYAGLRRLQQRDIQWSKGLGVRTVRWVSKILQKQQLRARRLRSYGVTLRHLMYIHTESWETAASWYTSKPIVTDDSLSCSTPESIWDNNEWWNSEKDIKMILNKSGWRLTQTLTCFLINIKEKTWRYYSTWHLNQSVYINLTQAFMHSYKRQVCFSQLWWHVGVTPMSYDRRLIILGLAVTLLQCDNWIFLCRLCHYVMLMTCHSLP